MNRERRKAAFVRTLCSCRCVIMRHWPRWLKGEYNWNGHREGSRVRRSHGFHFVIPISCIGFNFGRLNLALARWLSCLVWAYASLNRAPDPLTDSIPVRSVIGRHKSTERWPMRSANKQRMLGIGELSFGRLLALQQYANGEEQHSALGNC